jgi:predicted nucleotidyltransferase
MEIIKKAISVGNSSGVLLPKEWLGSNVKVVLMNPDPSKEIIEILMKKNILPKVLGAYIVGSYARGDQTLESDVDVLIITEDIDKRIVNGRYDILYISKKEVERQLEKNILPLLPMLKEAKTIINPELAKEYSSTKIDKDNFGYYIDTTKSAIQKVEEDIKFSKENNEKVSDASAYSLILRLRTLYILNCLKKKRLWNRKGFLEIIKKIAGSTKAYERYLSSKNKNSMQNELEIAEADRLVSYIKTKLKETEKWLQEEKD